MSWLIGLQVNLPLSSDDFPSLEPTEIFVLMFPSGILPKVSQYYFRRRTDRKVTKVASEGGAFFRRARNRRDESRRCQEAESYQPPGRSFGKSIRFVRRSAGSTHALGVERGLVRRNRQNRCQWDQESELVTTNRDGHFLVDRCASTVGIQCNNVDIDHA